MPEQPHSLVLKVNGVSVTVTREQRLQPRF